MSPSVAASKDLYPVPQGRTYEAQLQQNLGWALEEGSLFFEKKGAVQTTLRHIAQRLEELGIDYAVCGGMALFAHGFRRFTEDVDILVTEEGKERIHAELRGRGYLPPFEASKNLRDTETKVKIEFLIAGQFPGDGKPKAVAFPDPSIASTKIDGIRYLSLPRLVELKLASGISAADRRKDLGDVQELIRILQLPRSLGDQLSSYVVAKYRELWDEVFGQQRRYVTVIKNEVARPVQSLDDLIAQSPAQADRFEQMKSDRVAVDTSRPDRGIVLVTTDPAIAAKYEMEDERDVWPPEDLEVLINQPPERRP